jgi:hypothetical protein
VRRPQHSRPVRNISLCAVGVVLCGAIALRTLASIPLYGPMPVEIARLMEALWAGVGAGVASLTSGAAVAAWRARRVADLPSAVARLLQWLPRSMRDDAEGLIREFADVRDDDRRRGRFRVWTVLKCGWFMAVYVLRAAIALAFAELVGRLLR